MNNNVKHEYMDDWEKNNEASLHEKENFYSHLNICIRSKQYINFS